MKFEWDHSKEKANREKHWVGIRMKKEYDFSKAQQGKFYRPIEELEIPVYLDK